jgi:2C-methyl-D-erythritol 2,4-cyclodiphosphate synthase
MALNVLAKRPRSVGELLRRLDVTYWELHTKIRVELEKNDVKGALALILPQGVDSTTIFNRPSFFTPIEAMQQNIRAKLDASKLDVEVRVPDIAGYIIEVGVNSEIANRVE